MDSYRELRLLLLPVQGLFEIAFWFAVFVVLLIAMAVIP
jgi:hypothetical protein